MLGIHQSLNGLQMLAMDAKDIGADTFQCFLRNNRNLKMRSNLLDELPYFETALNKAGITKYVVHAPYTINPASDDFDKRVNAMSVIHEDLKLLSKLPYIKYYVLHPGSAGDLMRTDALLNLYDVLLKATTGVDMTDTYICLETMAGQGTQLLATPFEVMGIMSMFAPTSHIMVCFDTAHVFAAGYDVEDTLKLMCDNMKLPIGVVHLNQSMTYFGSRVDRHASITAAPANIPIEVLQHVAFRADYMGIPTILETPSDYLLQDYRECKSWLVYQ